jgi:hypothetical protein
MAGSSPKEGIEINHEKEKDYSPIDNCPIDHGVFLCIFPELLIV